MRKGYIRYKLKWLVFWSGRGGTHFPTNESKEIRISKEEKNPDKIAIERARKKVKKLPRRSAKTAVLKQERTVHRFR